MTSLTDISLIAQVVVAHNKRAFDTLVRKYQSQVRRFFLHQTLGDSFLSDDLAQETFIKAYLHLTSFRNLSSFPTWLLRIAYNVYYDYLRTRKETLSLDPANVPPTCCIEPAETGTRLDLYEALRTVRTEERLCLTLYYMEDLPVQKIADITGMPVNTVKSHLARGKDKVSTYLKQHGYD